MTETDWSRFNVNHGVRVRLTTDGLDVLFRDHPREYEKAVTNGGLWETQMWFFMQVFGGHINMGRSSLVPFETEIEVERTPSRLPLTQRQAEVLGYIRQTIAEHNYAPSFSEIAARFGFASQATVHEHLDNLERKGWITRRFNEARAITLVAA